MQKGKRWWGFLTLSNISVVFGSMKSLLRIIGDWGKSGYIYIYIYALFFLSFIYSLKSMTILTSIKQVSSCLRQRTSHQVLESWVIEQTKINLGLSQTLSTTALHFQEIFTLINNPPPPMKLPLTTNNIFSKLWNGDLYTKADTFLHK